GDNWKNFKYNFAARPKPFHEGRNVNAFNGFSIGKGHLAEAKAAINSGVAPKTMFDHHDHAGSCGTGDSSQRDELLAKIRTAKNPREDPPFSSPPPPLTFSRAAPVPFPRRDGRSPPSGTPPGCPTPPHSCPVASSSIARLTTSKSSNASRKPKATTTSSFTLP